MCIVKQAKSVLQANDRGTYTVPNDKLYPYQWLWDSGFVALGLMDMNEERAWQEIDSLMMGQWDNGMIPHIVFHQPHPTHAFGASLWDVAHPRVPTSGISQPPILSTIVRKMVESARDQKLAHTMLEKMVDSLFAYHRWYHAWRGLSKGLIATFHPWESGMDNSPAWDQPLSRIPRDYLEAYQRIDHGFAVEMAQRPTNDQYDGFMNLFFYMRKNRYDAEVLKQAPFRILDLAVNCALIRADKDLLNLAQRLNRADMIHPIEDWIKNAREGFDLLWSPEHESYLSYDLLDGAHIPVTTSASFLPLYAGCADADKVADIVKTLTRWMDQVKYSVPSTNPADPLFQENCYWRGPLWININWMIADGLRTYGFDALADRIVRDSLDVVESQGCWEFFNPFTAKGLGADNFSWTAALALYWNHTAS